jgi:hypothetical protein
MLINCIYVEEMVKVLIRMGRAAATLTIVDVHNLPTNWRKLWVRGPSVPS